MLRHSGLGLFDHYGFTKISAIEGLLTLLVFIIIRMDNQMRYWLGQDPSRASFLCIYFVYLLLVAFFF